jgi:hypothetical protein
MGLEAATVAMPDTLSLAGTARVKLASVEEAVVRPTSRPRDQRAAGLPRGLIEKRQFLYLSK